MVLDYASILGRLDLEWMRTKFGEPILRLICDRGCSVEKFVLGHLLQHPIRDIRT